ncbi:Glutathione peroxidase [Paragonimus heterotremus]|uniref:Glutathione peroxidase n=1 Tax=Paragonimus heterotremus TaxID=100268 RepID=A0A8J4WM16_9TREM|nr:Glutathione peroxidase [Paragonimus heterotremus]
MLHARLFCRGLRILAFPTNQFGFREPWPEKEVKRIVHEKYKIGFDLFSKVDIYGDDTHPLFEFLQLKTEYTRSMELGQVPGRSGRSSGSLLFSFNRTI